MTVGSGFLDIMMRGKLGMGLGIGLMAILGCSQGWAATPSPTPASWTSTTVIYRCANDVTIQVAYLNSGGATDFAAVLHDGQLHMMQSVPAASGVRYVAFDEQNSFRGWSKGDEGFLAFLAADHTATEQIVVKDCRAQG
ncbi:MAG: hypothetical protein OHK0012_00170 [Synechococcales cyanobacterium]